MMKKFKVSFTQLERVAYSCTVEAESIEEAITAIKKDPHEAMTEDWHEDEFCGSEGGLEDFTIDGEWHDNGDNSHSLKSFKQPIQIKLDDESE